MRHIFGHSTIGFASPPTPPPPQGVRVLNGRKTPVSPHPGKGRFGSENPSFSLPPHMEKWEFWTQNALFQCEGNRFFSPQSSLFQEWRIWTLYREKKSIHHHRGTPLFSVCRPTPRSQSKKSYGVYPFPGKTREKGIHHRSGKKGIHHRASDPEKEKKGGLHDGGVYFFLPCCRGSADSQN